MCIMIWDLVQGSIKQVFLIKIFWSYDDRKVGYSALAELPRFLEYQVCIPVGGLG